jgi:glycosyltransferase involved in cell wall biosynthesis
MTISIIITAHNDAHVLPEALDSILAQSRLPEEIFVVDDGSTDATAEVVRRYPAVTYIQQTHHGRPGPISSRPTTAGRAQRVIGGLRRRPAITSPSSMRTTSPPATESNGRRSFSTITLPSARASATSGNSRILPSPSA